MGWEFQANSALRACHVWYALVATARASVIKGCGSYGLPGGQRASLGSCVYHAEKHIFLRNREGD